MRISDWSSDVVSSDPGQVEADVVQCPGAVGGIAKADGIEADMALERGQGGARSGAGLHAGVEDVTHSLDREADRSEEHTSELQSLMRISYAVFCLTKKTNKPQHTRHAPQIQKN